MRVTRIRRGWAVLGLVVVLAIAAFRLLDGPVALESYRVLDPYTVAVIGYGASYAWPHVTAVTETDSTVTISVNFFTLQLGPTLAFAVRRYIPVYLSEPLGSRVVIDGSTGQPIAESGGQGLVKMGSGRPDAVTG